MNILWKSNSVKNHQCIMPSSLAVFLREKYFGCSTHNNLIQNPRSGGYLHILGFQINIGEREGVTGRLRLCLESITRSLNNNRG